MAADEDQDGIVTVEQIVKEINKKNLRIPRVILTFFIKILKENGYDYSLG